MIIGAVADIHGNFEALNRAMARHPDVPFWLCVGDLASRMITVSSNLATNILVEFVGVPAARRILAAAGVAGIDLVRGVEDDRAFDAGLSNRVTADGLVQLLRAIVDGRVGKRPTEQHLRCPFGPRKLMRPMHHRGHLARQRPLRLARLRRLGNSALERLNRRTIEPREHLQVRHHVAIVGIQEELIEAERRGALRVEPDRASLSLAELGP